MNVEESTNKSHANVYKREWRQTNGRRKLQSEQREERFVKRKWDKGVSRHHINKRFNVSRDQLTTNLSPLTSITEHT